jgi:hypothetical protein
MSLNVGQGFGISRVPNSFKNFMIFVTRSTPTFVDYAGKILFCLSV